MEYTVHGFRQKSNELFQLVGIDVEHTHSDGKSSLRQEYEILKKRDASAVLLHETDSDSLILVRQFRPATIDGENPWVDEIVAGGIDPGESPIASARRECAEEAGYEVDELYLIASPYVSPGITNERIHIYFAEVTSADRKHAGGGLADEQEDVQIISFPAESAAELVHQLVDAKSIIAVQWYLLQRQTS